MVTFDHSSQGLQTIDQESGFARHPNLSVGWGAPWKNGRQVLVRKSFIEMGQAGISHSSAAAFFLLPSPPLPGRTFVYHGGNWTLCFLLDNVPCTIGFLWLCFMG